MVDLPDLRARIRLDTSDLDAAAGRARGAGTAISAGIGGAVGGLLGGAIPALGRGLVTAFQGGVDELKGNQAALAQFESALTSTGNVANLSGKGIQSLADSIEAKTGTDGAAVVSGAALLATFTKVRNEAGEGGKVFDRATQAGVDLAAKGFGSVEGNAVLLGKALNDPIKGLSALGKQGVTFTEGQKATIKSLVATGDTLGAQKIILKEIEGQVGGSAEAYGKTLPGQLARASAAFDGVKETVVKALLPALNGGLAFITGTLIPGFQGFADAVGPTIAQVVTEVRKLLPPIQELLPVIRDGLGQAFATLAPVVQTVAGALVTFVSAIPVPVLAGIAAAIGTVAIAMGVQAAATAVVSAATGAYAAVQGALNAVLALNPILLVVAALAALGVGLVLAYRNSETFRAIVDKAFSGVKAAGQALASFFTSTIPAAFQTVKDRVGSIVSALSSALSAAWAAIRAAVTGAFEAVKATITGAFDAVRTTVTTVLEVVRAVIGGAFAAYRALVTTALEAIRLVVTTVFTAVRTAITSALDAVRSAFTTAWAAITGTVTTALAAVRSAVTTALAAIVALVAGLAGRAVSALSSLGSSVAGVATAAFGAMRGAVGAGIDTVLSLVGTVSGRVVSALGNLGGLLVDAGGDLLRGLARGITGAIGGVVSAAVDAARAAVSAVKSALGINSPSRVFAALGVNTGEGFALGITRSTGGVQDALRDLVALPDVGALRVQAGAALTAGTPEARSAGGAVARQGDTYNVTVEVDVHDLTELQTVVGFLDNLKVQARRTVGAS